MDKEQKTEKLEALIRHVDEVRKNCHIMAFRLIDDGKFELAKRLIANSYKHDNSKFYALEWQHLTKADDDDDMLDVAIKIHASSNMHHPEYWDGIENMPDFALGEAICDWKARSTELGTSLKDWIDNGAAKKYKFTKKMKIYKRIMYFYNLVVETSL